MSNTASHDRVAARIGSRFGPLLPDYRVPEGHYDELRTTSGEPRLFWEEFGAQAGELTPDFLTHAQARIDRQIHENGVTYNVYAAERGPARPWTLDVLPLIVPPGEWERLSPGLRQYARLLNAVAADIYGPQRLLHEGLIPPALVFRHPGYLRACHQAAGRGGTLLHLIGLDLGRGPDGRWRVVGVRTQTPSGIGYALENRTSIARQFPDALRALGVHPLTPFTQALQKSLLAAVPCDDEAARVVLLTPGPYNETYFEHAYLARQLGFPLVEGGDLTVRQDRVFMKTVSGLVPVHGILRRLDDTFCDPLELRPDSTIGVPGLTQASRAGRVLVANALGTGMFESPAWLGFLAPVCERLFGERLEIGALPTWWCGEAASFGEVRGRLDRHVIKPVFPDAPFEPVFASALTPSDRAGWLRRVEADPESFVIEDYVPLSHAPVWHDRTLEARALMLRVFLLSDGNGDYQVMPGGLARIAGDDRHSVSGQRGGGSKDTWVPSGVPADGAALDRRTRTRDEMPLVERSTTSRVAEHLFWLGRYAERSENCARLLRAVLDRLPEAETFTASLRRAVLVASRRHSLIDATQWSDEPAPAAAGTPALERALIDAMFDRSRGHSLGFNLERTLQVAGAARDRLSSDNWRLLNRLFQSIEDVPAHGVELDAALELIDQAIVTLVAVGGLEMAHMTRDHGWRFLSLGRHLERLWFMASTLDDIAAERPEPAPAVLEWLLDLSDSLITYRSRYLRSPEWPSVVDLLVFDDRNPRSVIFQFSKLAKHVRLLPDAALVSAAADIDYLMRACRMADGDRLRLVAGGAALADLLSASHRLAGRLSDALAQRYFSHAYDLPHATSAP